MLMLVITQCSCGAIAERQRGLGGSTCLAAQLPLQHIFGGAPDMPDRCNAQVLELVAHVPAHSRKLIHLQIQQVCIHLQCKYRQPEQKMKSGGR